VTSDPESSEPASPHHPVDGEQVDEGLARRQGREATDGDTAEPTVKEPKRARPAKSSTRNALEWVAVVVGAIVIALVVRTFVLQTFWIPSPSMSETLVEGDRVLVNKLAYDFHDVNRGDVVVFKRPPAEPASAVKDLIKRVVALPGERVSIVDGGVRIDGQTLDEPYVNGLQTIYDSSCSSVELLGIDTDEGYEVPEGQLFVMGDNRVNSRDGRCFGPVDEGLLVGRAFFILWPPSRAGGL
jgi:signal peptidase I